MTSRWLWHLSQITRRMWFRASLFSILAVVTALAAIVLAPYIPSDLPTKIGADAVDNILGIIASSMLAVTTFSLSTMVAAYSAATSNVTPRATRLVMEDTTTQNVLATFIGSFLYSLVGIIALSTGAYGSTGRVVLFVVTAGVIVLIVVTLLRWIDHLSRLGRVTETTERVDHHGHRAPVGEVVTHDDPQGRPAPGRDGAVARGRAGGVCQHVDGGLVEAVMQNRDLVEAEAPRLLIHEGRPRSAGSRSQRAAARLGKARRRTVAMCLSSAG